MRLRSTPLFRFLSSIQLAVPVLLGLAAILAVATVYESWYGMRGAHVLVYGTTWFYGVLFLLGLNVFCAAWSRYPWKKHQTGFVITHSGILVILLGSWITMQFGVDGILPVVEGGEAHETSLHRLEVSLVDETTGKAIVYPLRESATKREGELLSVRLPGQERLVVESFYPRARYRELVEASPVPGLGKPAVRIDLANDRFRLHEWLSIGGPGVAEKNLGPAILSFQKLTSPQQEAAFLRGALDPVQEPRGKQGHLLVSYLGKSYKVDVENSLRRWKRLGSSPVEVRIERYLPYAIVQKGELVNKSDNPVNPTVQLEVRDALGRRERHTVFANFPEFTTLHGGKSKKPTEKLPVKLRMISSAMDPESAPGSGKGRLLLAQTADDSRLLYRVLNRQGKVNAQGVVAQDQSQPTGWMNLQFAVTQWYPYSVQKVVPQYVDRLSGGSENFASAILLRHERPVGSSQPGGEWLFEGERRYLNIQGKNHSIRYGKQHLGLPFRIYLEKFTIGHDPGTQKAASYESDVVVRDVANEVTQHAHISMNEPLVYGGYTFYQASYQLRDGLPPVSVFSVNYDPGRWVKYAGSLILCLGIALMFYMNPHYWSILFGARPKKGRQP